MLEIPKLKGKTIVLRKIKESDIDDRLCFGRPKEFAYMCGGNRDEIVEFPSREEWENKKFTPAQFILVRQSLFRY